MTLDDFKRLTPEEFGSVIEAAENRERGSWERMRVLAVTILRPHLKKGQRGKSDRELMPLPWDKEQKEPRRVESRAEAYARFKELTSKDGEQ